MLSVCNRKVRQIFFWVTPVLQENSQRLVYWKFISNEKSLIEEIKDFWLKFLLKQVVVVMGRI